MPYFLLEVEIRKVTVSKSRPRSFLFIVHHEGEGLLDLFRNLNGLLTNSSAILSKFHSSSCCSSYRPFLLLLAIESVKIFCMIDIGILRHSFHRDASIDTNDRGPAPGLPSNWRFWRSVSLLLPYWFPDIGRWEAVGFGEVLEAALTGCQSSSSLDIVEFLFGFLIMSLISFSV